jgi:hypothetical protein
VLKWLRRLLLVLLLALLLGLAIGAALRLRLERPVYYIGSADGPGLTLPPCGGPLVEARALS